MNALTGRLDWPRPRGVQHTCCHGGERCRRWAPRRWRPDGIVCEAAHTMRVPRGTRGPARTSPWRSKEALPTLTMMVDEQLPPARTVTGGAGGRGFARFSWPNGLTLRESAGFVLKWAGPDKWAGPVTLRSYRLFGRFFAGGAGKERKKLGAAGAGRRPGRNGEEERRERRGNGSFR